LRILYLSADDRFSQRAHEVAEDLFAALDEELRKEGCSGFAIEFHLDNSSVLLDRAGAEIWIKESVDAGYPNIGFHIEEQSPGRVLINLAAYEDPDSQFFE
jgi:hypothetical protein